MLKIFIAEDELKTLNSIKHIIETYCADTIIAGSAQSVKDAVDYLSQHTIDLVLFDINFPDGTGFDILNQLESYQFKVIFITAFEEYALKAIKFSAVDYLLKPVNPKELIASVNKTNQDIKTWWDKPADNSLLNIQTLLSNIKTGDKKYKKIVLKTQERIHVVDINTIIRCESDGGYTTFYINNGQHILLSKSLIEYDELLKDYGFIRTHKSHLVNVEFIDSFEKLSGYLRMKDQSKIPVSVRKKELLLNVLDNF